MRGIMPQISQPSRKRLFLTVMYFQKQYFMFSNLALLNIFSVVNSYLWTYGIVIYVEYPALGGLVYIFTVYLRNALSFEMQLWSAAEGL